MRLKACLGLILLATGGCAQLPGLIHVDVDGSTLDFKKKPVPPPPTPPAPEPTPTPDGRTR